VLCLSNSWFHSAHSPSWITRSAWKHRYSYPSYYPALIQSCIRSHISVTRQCVCCCLCIILHPNKHWNGRTKLNEEVLNCIDITACITCVFEADGSRVHLRWSAVEVRGSRRDWRQDEGVEDPQFVIEDEDESDNEVEGSSKPCRKAEIENEMLPSLGERLFTV